MTLPDPDKPSSETETLTLTLPSDLSGALDRLMQARGDASDRSGALLHGFREWATAQGLVAQSDSGLRPEELNAANDD